MLLSVQALLFRAVGREGKSWNRKKIFSSTFRGLGLQLVVLQKFRSTMRIFLLVFRVAGFLSTSESLLLKDYTTECLYGSHKISFDRGGDFMAVSSRQ